MDEQGLKEMLASAIRVTRMDDGLRIATQCLYPSNNSVIVAVRGGTDQFTVSDEGGAAIELGSAGYHETMTDRQIRPFVKAQGLKVDKGLIYSPVVSYRSLPAAIVLVANASKEVADWGTEHLRLTVRRNFKADLATLLDRHFHDNLKHDSMIIGASNKPHKFGHVIYLGGERKLIVDPVVNDASSINARVVANMDVKMANDPSITQVIVYDDAERWDAASLKLLELGAKTVGFSHAEQTIARLAA